MAFDVITGTAPDSWACYLVNGDAGELSPAELKAADSFAAWLGGSVVSCEDSGFHWRPDSFPFWPFGASCQTYSALVKKDS